MQFIKKTSSSRNIFNISIKIALGLFIIIGLVVKSIFGLVIVLGVVFILNSIDFPAPKKEIEKIIPNENFKIVK